MSNNTSHQHISKHITLVTRAATAIAVTTTVAAGFALGGGGVPATIAEPAPVTAPAAPTVTKPPAPAIPPAHAPAPAQAVNVDLYLRPAHQTYTDDLDGWILEALDVMAAHGIPGSYEGIYRNVMRESSGNPQAINLYDSNAAAGIPSKGLLQVIDPTFEAYHVDGTPDDIWHPVANIAAACNYAADRYGSIDNVNGPY